MKSVINCLNSENFIRIRVGIGTPEYKGDLINYVIGSAIPESEKKELDSAIDVAAKAVLEILKSGIDIAMNKFNTRKEN